MAVDLKNARMRDDGVHGGDGSHTVSQSVIPQVTPLVDHPAFRIPSAKSRWRLIPCLLAEQQNIM